MAASGLISAIAALFSIAGPIEPVADIESGLERLEASWRSGDLHDVSHLAHEVVEMIERSDCPWREDVVTAAFMGMAASAQEGPSDGHYLSWVADTVSGAIAYPALPGLAEMAETLRAEPGEYVNLDYRFVTSPYLDGSPEPGCAPRRLDPELLFAEPDEASSLVLAVEAGNWNRPISTSRLLYAYPLSEGEAVHAEMGELGERFQFEGILVVAFEPCYQFMGRRGRHFEVCRPGEAREEPRG